MVLSIPQSSVNFLDLKGLWIIIVIMNETTKVEAKDSAAAIALGLAALGFTVALLGGAVESSIMMGAGVTLCAGSFIAAIVLLPHTSMPQK